MSENWNTTMGEALRLTRAGQLAEATSLLQHGLAGKAGGPQPGATGARTWPTASMPSGLADHTSLSPSYPDPERRLALVREARSR